MKTSETALKKKIIRHIILLLFLIGVLGCSPIINGFYGIKRPRHLDQNQILYYGEKLNLPVEDIFQIDTTYLSFVLSLDTNKFRSEQKNHYQQHFIVHSTGWWGYQPGELESPAGKSPALTWRVGLLPPGRKTEEAFLSTHRVRVAHQ